MRKRTLLKLILRSTNELRCQVGIIHQQIEALASTAPQEVLDKIKSLSAIVAKDNRDLTNAEAANQPPATQS